MLGGKVNNFIYNNSRNICSIDQLDSDDIQEMLLSNQRNDKRIDTIAEEKDELFQLYITPYSQMGSDCNKGLKPQQNQPQTALKENNPKWGHSNSQTYSKQIENQFEMLQLQRVIKEKDSQIESLGRQLRVLREQISNLYCVSHMKQKGGECQIQLINNKKNHKRQLMFLQKNNQELYSLMNQYKCQKDNQERELKKILISHRALESKIADMHQENLYLKGQNKKLLKEAEQHFLNGKLEIKLVKKMRDILAEKLSLNEGNATKLEESNSKLRQNIGRQLKTDKKVRSNSTTFQTAKSHKSNQKSASRINPEGISNFDEKMVIKKIF